MRLSNRCYDIMKYVVMIAIPAILTFLATVLPLFGVSVDLTQTIVAIGTAVDTLLGTLLGISTAIYNKEKSVEEYEAEDDR